MKKVRKQRAKQAAVVAATEPEQAETAKAGALSGEDMLIHGMIVSTQCNELFTDHQGPWSQGHIQFVTGLMLGWDEARYQAAEKVAKEKRSSRIDNQTVQS